MLPPQIPRDLPGERMVGITTTLPVETIMAANLVPVDLNNLFVTSPSRRALVDRAEQAGFPRTCCCWTKGLYGAVHEFGIRTVVGVARGDCSNAEALLDVLAHEGVRTLTFDYPRSRDAGAMQAETAKLADLLGADMQEAETWRQRLQAARSAAAAIDNISHSKCRVHGLENHLWLVSTSDFCADPEGFRAAAERFLYAARKRQPIAHRLRLGVCGIPPIVTDLFDFLEEQGALVVYNETPRQFSLPGGGDSLGEVYVRYTYPYGVGPRVEDIRSAVRLRRLDGVIHYVQSFCHRRIEDRIIREGIGVPVLTVEADAPGPLSGQLKTRLEAFAQMLAARKSGRTLF